MTAFWIIYIGLILYHIVGGLFFRLKLSTVIRENNDLKIDSKKVFMFYIICPLIVLTVPLLLSWINGFKYSLYDFYYPSNFRFEFCIFHVIILIFLFIGGFWIYIRNGAEILSKYPSIMRAKVGFKIYRWLYISKVDIQAYYGIFILVYVFYLASIFIKNMIK